MKIRRGWAVFWIVIVGVAVLAAWGEWLDWRRRAFALRQVHTLERRIMELEGEIER